jgi:hypothetical protein
MTDCFSPLAAEALNYYVYTLVDPRDRRVFYVGKGKGDRVFHHAAHARASVDQHVSVLSEKLDLINEIHAQGRAVEKYVIRHGLSSTAAFEVEAAIIDTLRLLSQTNDNNDLFSLKNAVLGHHSSVRGLVGVDAINAAFSTEPAPPINVPSILIRIPRLWTPLIGQRRDGAELYDATRQWWKIGQRRTHARYAFSVSRGVVRQVYAIEPGSWEAGSYDADTDSWNIVTPSGKVRWRFAGRPAPEMERYLDTSVAHLFKRGEASPIRYLNC